MGQQIRDAEATALVALLHTLPKDVHTAGRDVFPARLAIGQASYADI